MGRLRRLDQKQVQEPSQALSPLGAWGIRKPLSVPLVELGFRVPRSSNGDTDHLLQASTTQHMTECRVMQQGRRQTGAPARKMGEAPQVHALLDSLEPPPWYLFNSGLTVSKALSRPRSHPVAMSLRPPSTSHVLLQRACP